MKEILYKAIVTEQKTKERKIISFHACSLTEALHELRANGYSVNNYKCKPAEVFDYITKHTNCTPWDWREIKTVPQD